MAAAPMPFPGLGPTPGSSALDGPPPSPTPMGGVDQNGPFSMSGLAPQSIPSGQMPPEVLTGVTQAAQSMNELLDSFVQIMPNKGPQIGLIKDMLQQLLAEVMADGAGPVSPTAAGPAPPMGGMDRGISGPGAV
jgi:hypothetical protein